MDDLIEKLLDLFESRTEAKRILKECIHTNGGESEFYCQGDQADVDEIRVEIKETMKAIVDVCKEDTK